MKASARSFTAEEFGRLTAADVRQELVRGEIQEMPPPKSPHGSVTGKIQGELYAFVTPRKLGRVFGEMGFLLERGPDTVRSPDCAFVRAARLPSPLPDEYLTLAPDLAVETLSPDDGPKRIRERAALWLDAGVAMLWIADPRARTVTVHRPAAKPRVLRDGDVLEGDDVIPGFRLEVAGLWD